MTEGKEKKKKTAASAGEGGQMQRSKEMTSGEMLRAARLQRKLGLEEISGSIHIRVAQLRALEEGNIEALPGMTYALGFVRSYANFLKINSAEVVNKFKAEHGAMKPVMPELHIPSPPPENRMPDPMLTGIAVFSVILLLVLWTIFSGGDEDVAAVEQAEAIPPAPVVQMAGETAPSPSLVTEPSETAPVIAPFPQMDSTTPAKELAATPLVTAALPTAAADEIQAGPVMMDIALPKERPAATPPAPVSVDAVAAPAPEERAEVINVKRTKSRITIVAREASWIQVDDGHRRTIFKRVLKPGEKFPVPDEPGMSLITSNAGGIDLYVDGRKQQAIGKSGEIVRGVILEPGSVSKRRVRVNNY